MTTMTATEVADVRDQVASMQAEIDRLRDEVTLRTQSVQELRAATAALRAVDAVRLTLGPRAHLAALEPLVESGTFRVRAHSLNTTALPTEDLIRAVHAAGRPMVGYCSMTPPVLDVR